MSVYHEEEWRASFAQRKIRVEVVRECVVYEYLDLYVEVENAASEVEALKAAEKCVVLEDLSQLRSWDKLVQAPPGRPYVYQKRVLHESNPHIADYSVRLRDVPERMPVEGNLELPFSWD